MSSLNWWLAIAAAVTWVGAFTYYFWGDIRNWWARRGEPRDMWK